MASNDVRKILMRALVDESFLDKWERDPASILEGYQLTDLEQEAIKKRDVSSLTKLSGVGPGADDAIVVVIVIVIAATDGDGGFRQFRATSDAVRSLVDSIHRTSGKERFANIVKLVSEIAAR